jgi:hypothetical protein
MLKHLHLQASVSPGRPWSGFICRSIGKGAVEAENQFICAAVRGHLGDAMSDDIWPRTQEAGMSRGMVQSKSLQALSPSSVEGAAEAGSKSSCVTL